MTTLVSKLNRVIQETLGVPADRRSILYDRGQSWLVVYGQPYKNHKAIVESFIDEFEAWEIVFETPEIPDLRRYLFFLYSPSGRWLGSASVRAPARSSDGTNIIINYSKQPREEVLRDIITSPHFSSIQRL